MEENAWKSVTQNYQEWNLTVDLKINQIMSKIFHTVFDSVKLCHNHRSSFVLFHIF